MLGTLRFGLALLVLLSHIPHLGMPINLGVSSVIVFYFISGFLMGRSFLRFQQFSTKPIRAFYVDRVIKLMPQYCIVLLATCALLILMGPAENTFLMNQSVDTSKFFLNLLLLPTNYTFEPLSFTALQPAPLIPPAWSLASEFHFYLLLPLLLFFEKRGFAIVFFLAAGVQISAMFFADGPFNSNNFGYRFIFGALIFFLAGIAFGRNQQWLHHRLSMLFVLVYSSLLLIIAPWKDLFDNPLVKEVLIGAVLAMPLLKLALLVQLQGNAKQLDDWLGRLAYPIFISHFLAFLICEKFLHLTFAQGTRFVWTSMLISLACSLLLSRLQTHIERYRVNRRGFASMQQMSVRVQLNDKAPLAERPSAQH